MKLNKLMAAAFACMSLTASALADSTTWGDWVAGGTSCNYGNVDVIKNGDSLSILFNEFAVVMPQYDLGDGTTSRKTCNFRIEFSPPNGFYLAGFKQLYSGGMIKSRNSQAQLQISYYVGAVRGRPMPVVFPRGMEITATDPRSVFTKEYVNNLAIANCGGKTTYGINMTLLATRPDPYGSLNEYIIGGLDSVDAELRQSIVLIPEWRLCGR